MRAHIFSWYALSTAGPLLCRKVYANGAVAFRAILTGHPHEALIESQLHFQNKNAYRGTHGVVGSAVVTVGVGARRTRAVPADALPRITLQA